MLDEFASMREARLPYESATTPYRESLNNARHSARYLDLARGWEADERRMGLGTGNTARLIGALEHKIAGLKNDAVSNFYGTHRDTPAASLDRHMRDELGMKGGRALSYAPTPGRPSFPRYEPEGAGEPIPELENLPSRSKGGAGGPSSASQRRRRSAVSLVRCPCHCASRRRRPKKKKKKCG